MGLSFTAPLAGRDDWEQPESTNPYKFQSTRPLRGATASASADLIVPLFQSTHPLRGATKKATQVQPARRISIHAPLAGRDERGLPTDRAGSKDFNPRAPCGARLFGSVAKNQGCDISIHAPLAGRDGSGKAPLPVPGNFNPRAPCGARQQKRTKKCGAFAQIVQIQALCVQKMHIRRLDGRIFFKKYALFRCELFGKSVRAFGSHS